LVIDDFHHFAPDVQQQIVLAIKPIVNKSLRAVLVGVPHHAADVVAAQGEMEGRVDAVRVGIWDTHELREIARLGFPALNLTCSGELIDEIAGYAMRSPHLMQLLCRELCKANGIRRAVEGGPVAIQPPAGWAAFLGEIARRWTADKALRTLAQGPQSRSPRIRRERATGGTTDTYGAIIAAIARTGPLEQLSYDQLRDSLRHVLEPDSMPQKNEITSCLRHLTAIAKKAATDEHGRLQREPVLEYVASEDLLHITDPYLAFRLRWGPDPLATAAWHEDVEGDEEAVSAATEGD
jgi:hypothetical protein